MNKLIELFGETESKFGKYLKEVNLQELIQNQEDLEDSKIDKFSEAFSLFKEKLADFEPSFLWGAIIYWSDTIGEKSIRSFMNKKNKYWKDNENENRYDYILKYMETKNSKEYITLLTDLIFKQSSKKKPIAIFKKSCSIDPCLENFELITVFLDELWDDDKIQKFIGNELKSINYSIANYVTLNGIFAEDKMSKVKENILTQIIDKLSNELEIKEIDTKKFLNFLLWTRMYDDKWKAIYYFPALLLEGGVGGAILSFEKKISPQSFILLQEFINRFWGQLGLFYAKEIAKMNIKKHGTRAAAASIIGRNMSHNIGSHVIYYLSNSFQNSDRNLFNNTLKEFIEECNKNKNKNPLTILEKFKKDEGDKINAFDMIYDDMSIFLNYIQGRMDYVALVGTIEPGYGQGIKIKDLIDEFKGNRFLRDGIAASEGVKTIDIERRDEKSFNGLVTIPFGEIGKHAFFSILENIIRNSAKRGHDEITDGKLLLYYYATKNTDNGTIDLEIYDDLKTYEKARLAMNLPKRGDELNAGKKTRLAMHLSKEDKKPSAIESPLIDDKGSLVHEYMGIKEMKISAAFLKMIPFYEIDSEKYKEKEKLLLDLVPCADSLMYKIRLLPYKNLLIVAGGDKGLSSVNEECGIDKAGIEYLKKQDKPIGEYKIAVSNLQLDAFKEEVKNKLPNRLVCDQDISNKFNDATILNVYKKWIETTYSINDLGQKKIYYKPSVGENEETLKEKWEGILYVGENINDCHVRFQGHLDKFQHYVYAYDEKMKDEFETAEDVSKRSHILKERLNNPSEKKLDKQLLRLELLESAFSRVLIIDERLFSEYQCHWHDFEINGKKYRINYGNKVLPDQENGRKTFNFPYDEFIKIAEWLCKNDKTLEDVSFCCNGHKLKYKKGEKSVPSNVSYIIKDCVKRIGTKKTMEYIKFLYEKRKDFYRFSLKNIEIGNFFTTEENNKVSFVNLEGKPLFSLKKNDDERLSLNWGNEALNKFHFFSLHLGIIDKIREMLNCSENAIIKDFDSALKNTDFILHTGRGKTLQTKDYPIRFMDFTTLNNWVNGSKWLLVQGLYSIKKRTYE